MNDMKKLNFPGCTMKFQLNVPQLIKRGITYFPKQEIVYRTHENEIKRYTYEDLYKNSCRLANTLKELGVRPGDRVGVYGTNVVEVMECHIGIILAGAVVNSVNPRFSQDYIIAGINRMEDKVALVDKSLLPLFEQISSHLSSVKHVIIFPEKGDTSLNYAYSYNELIGNASFEMKIDALLDIDEWEAAFHQCTTGTTGVPKACLFSHRGMYLQTIGQSLAESHRFTQYDTILHIIPSYHGFWFYHFTGWQLGMKQVFIGPNMDPEWVLRLIQDEKVTCCGGTPEVWGMILGALRAQESKGIKYNLNSMNRVFLAGTAPSLAIQKKFSQLGIEPMHVFGMTEMHGPYGTVSKPKPYMDLSEEEAFKYRKKQGIPLPFINVKGIDDEGESIPWDGKTIGELCMRGATILGEHYNMPEETDALWTEDGWFRSGDLITIDDEGYMEIQDRKKDLIKSGGEFISTIELGAKILEHPKVYEVAVVGCPHPKWGERPLAAIVPTPESEEVSEEEIIQHLVPLVPKWWLPDKIVFLSELPKTSVGKIDKSVLKEKYKDYKLPEEPVYKKIV